MVRLTKAEQEAFKSLNASYLIVHKGAPVDGGPVGTRIFAKAIDLTTRKPFAQSDIFGSEIEAVRDVLKKARKADRPMSAAETAAALDQANEEIENLKAQLAIARGESEVAQAEPAVDDDEDEEPPFEPQKLDAEDMPDPWEALKDDDLDDMADAAFLEGYDPNGKWGRDRKIKFLKEHGLNP
jgi:hypothetical protein